MGYYQATVLHWLFSRSHPQITIPEPCRENWEEMDGTSSVRFCQKCQHSVHNLSAMTRGEVTRLIESADGARLCGRITKDPRGKVVFRSEPPKRSRPLALVTLTALAGPAAAVAQTPRQSCAVTISVADITEAVIPEAGVMLRTGADPLTGTTDGNGSFSTEIPIGGGAEMTISAPGFKDSKLALRCDHGENLDVQTTLNVADQWDSVDVRAEVSVESLTTGGVLIAVYHPTPWQRLKRFIHRSRSIVRN